MRNSGDRAVGLGDSEASQVQSRKERQEGQEPGWIVRMCQWTQGMKAQWRPWGGAGGRPGIMRTEVRGRRVRPVMGAASVRYLRGCARVSTKSQS